MSFEVLKSRIVNCCIDCTVTPYLAFVLGKD